jgi:hypothetical protein
MRLARQRGVPAGAMLPVWQAGSSDSDPYRKSQDASFHKVPYPSFVPVAASVMRAI